MGRGNEHQISFPGASATSGVQIRGRNGVVAAQDHGPLDDIFQLPDIPRPGVAQKDFHDLRLQSDSFSVVGPGIFLHKVRHQQRNVFGALPERRHLHMYDVEPIKQVLPKLPASTSVFKSRLEAATTRTSTRMVCSRPPVRIPFPAAPYRLDLQRRGHFRNFIEEQGSRFSQLKTAFAHGEGISEGPFFMAEQFAFEQGLGQGAAVGTNGPDLGSAACMAPAMSSLPVPLSPATRTVALVWATFSTMAKMLCMASLLPTIF